MNGYVPWDVSYLTDFYNYVTSAMGKATNLGIKIFGIILAFAVVSMVIRRFTR